MKNTVILAAYSNFTRNNVDGHLMPIRGKPAIGWVVEQATHNSKVFVVVNKENTKLIEYISKIYSTRFDVHVVEINAKEELQNYGAFTIINSFNKGLSKIDDNCDDLELILGDTLVRGVPSNTTDFVMTSKDFTSSSKWCLVSKDKDGFINEIFDKQKDLDTSDKQALVGYYRFSNPSLVKEIVGEFLENLDGELSHFLKTYNEEHKLKAINCNYWFDLGHKSGVIKAQNEFFNSRDFNSLSADFVKGVITKRSPKIQKLADEFFWYNELPEELKIFVPRALSFHQSIDNASLEMEMYGYPALSELFVFGNVDVEEWELILRKLFSVHKLFEKYEGTLDVEDLYDLYLHKTWQRLLELQNQNPIWKEYWAYDELVINNKIYKNIKNFEVKINDAIIELIDNSKITTIHGDYCFSNILFDTNNHICRLIDPRGRLKEQTIYGDPRYDIAKLRHSVVGYYDFAVHRFFGLSEDKNKFMVEEYVNEDYSSLKSLFDDMVVEFGYNLKEIRLIEALLFTSMIPLHKDDLQRQKLFYLKAVTKLNEVFGEN
ncbi:MAG: hypothetical protein BWY78_00136 [Alphaproteobacteria bacterium ADurb.Bin438]|nr:MAG: hypothetical protein BWY78_00136 [Alphaproteobacteria bacterium ADurb.Bin438]